MEIRGKEQELAVLDDELAGVLDDPALAEEDHLPPGPQCIADDGPFFECDLEGARERHWKLPAQRFCHRWGTDAHR